MFSGHSARLCERSGAQTFHPRRPLRLVPPGCLSGRRNSTDRKSNAQRQDASKAWSILGEKRVQTAKVGLIAAFALTATTLAACEPVPTRGSTATSGDLRIEMALTPLPVGSAPVPAPANLHEANAPEGGAFAAGDPFRVSIAMFDEKTSVPVEHAVVWLSLSQLGRPGHHSILLQPIKTNAAVAFAGDVTLARHGEFKLDVHVRMPSKMGYWPMRGDHADVAFIRQRLE